MVFWYVFPRFSMLYQEKSGNSGHCNSLMFPTQMQGDPIGRIFTFCVIFYLRQFLENYRSPKFGKKVFTDFA
jgi:hypothetical protein